MNGIAHRTLRAFLAANTRPFGTGKNAVVARLKPRSYHLHSKDTIRRRRENNTPMHLTFGGLGLLTFFGMWYTASLRLSAHD